MHIVEQYAINCGAKINKPFIREEFFPLTFDKYITLHSPNKFPSRDYDYWQEVIDLIHPFLLKNNIKIIQIGSPDERMYSKCVRTNGMTNYKQLAYIIKNSLLHVGVDSLPIHLASIYDKKILAIFSNVYKEISKPYWGSSDNQILIQSDRKNKKPSFSTFEEPKTINNISPSEISSKILNLLGIKNDLIKYEYIHLGKEFNRYKIDQIPNHLVQPSQNIQNVNIRMDLVFDENTMHKQLNLMKCAITTSRPINKNALIPQNIAGISLFIEDENSVDFLKILKSLNIKYNLFSLLNEDELSKLKLKYMDYGLIIPINYNIENYKQIITPILNTKKIYYKSNKKILSNGNIYLSDHDFLFNKNSLNNINDNTAEFTDINILKENPENFILFTID